MEFEILVAKTNNLDEIVELLNYVSRYLHRKGIHQWEYPWNPLKILEDIEKNNVYIVKNKDNVIATFSMSFKEVNPWEVNMSEYVYLYRIAVLNKYKGCGLGNIIIKHTFKIAENMNSVIYLDCWAGNKKLRDFYINEGLHYVGDYPEDDYCISVFKY